MKEFITVYYPNGHKITSDNWSRNMCIGYRWDSGYTQCIVEVVEVSGDGLEMWVERVK